MKVLVINNAAPFVKGGAELLAENLVNQLNAVVGIDAELLRIPFSWEPAERLIEEIVLNRQLRIINVDKVIALKFPAYLIPHSDKTLWLLHQFRQAYDLHNSKHDYLQGERGREIIRLVRNADNSCFETCRKIFTNSPVTRDRLLTYNGVKSALLYPPLNDPEIFQPGDYNNYIFCGGRINRGKRQQLLIEGMRYVRREGRLVISGPPDTEDDAQELTGLVAKYQLDDRVTLDFGYHSRSHIAQYVNNCLACAAAPIDEDSLSYVTMEAFCAAKSVLTTSDSGGLLEIVQDGVSGFVVAANAESIGDGLDRLFQDRKGALLMGRQAKSIWANLKLNWPNTIDRLLEE